MRVVIAEDLALLRDGMIRLLRDHGHEVVAAVEDGDALVRAAAGHKPDICVEAHLQHLRQARPAAVGHRPPPRAGGARVLAGIADEAVGARTAGVSSFDESAKRDLASAPWRHTRTEGIHEMRRDDPSRHGRAADALIASYLRELIADDETDPQPVEQLAAQAPPAALASATPEQLAADATS